MDKVQDTTLMTVLADLPDHANDAVHATPGALWWQLLAPLWQPAVAPLFRGV
jgi:hypothetical protein